MAKERRDHTKDYLRWIASLATIALGGAGIGLADRVNGLGAWAFMAFVGAMSLSLICAAVALLLLPLAVPAVLAEIDEPSPRLQRFVNLSIVFQLLFFLLGMLAIALTILTLVRF